MNLDDFLARSADRGPCVGIRAETAAPLVAPPGVELRTIDGVRTTTLDALLGAFAEAWHFPPWFGRNMNAFNDFMRDLDNMINTALGKPPARDYLTEVTDAHLLLVDQPDAFPGSPITYRFTGITTVTKPAHQRLSVWRFPLPPLNSPTFANTGSAPVPKS